jgi:cysteine desulfurase
MKRIYMDHAATSPVADEVLEAMLPYFTETFGNASSLHYFGRQAREALEDSRAKVADLIGAAPGEIYFTSGGTESDNLAVRGTALKNRSKGRHIITTSIEHPAVLEVFRNLESQGFEATYLPVTKEGLVDLDALESALRPDTILVSVMHANNEIGTIQPIAEIGEITRERGIYFHTDAVQTAGKIPIDVSELNLDMLSISSHKLYGPKGVGALYVKRGTEIESITQGGGHERNLRSGTENVAGIVGLGKAAELGMETMPEEIPRLSALRDKLKETVLNELEESWINGHPAKRLPGNLNFGFLRVEGEALLFYLDSKGIAASTGSACSSAKTEASHVLTALGLKPEEAHGSLRITMGKSNTKEDVQYVGEVIIEAVNKFRAISPL